jgi:hypothetical protein
LITRVVVWAEHTNRQLQLVTHNTYRLGQIRVVRDDRSDVVITPEAVEQELGGEVDIRSLFLGFDDTHKTGFTHGRVGADRRDRV